MIENTIYKWLWQIFNVISFLSIFTICQSQPRLNCPGESAAGEWKFSPDGSKIVNHEINCSTKRTWDLATGKMITLDTGCYFGDRWIEIQPTGRFAFTRIDMKDSVNVWDLNTGRLKYILKGYYGEFSPDGTLILTNIVKPDSTMVWDVNTGNLIYSLPGTYAEFSRDGKWIINRSNTRRINYPSINIFESATGRFFRNVIFNYEDYSISEDGRHLFIGNRKKTNTYNIISGKKLSSIRFRMNYYSKESIYHNMLLSNKITSANSGEWRGEAKLLEVTTGSIIKKIEWICCNCLGVEITFPNKTAFSPDGKYFYIHLNCSTSGIFNCATGDLIATLETGEYVYGTEYEQIKFSKDGRLIGTSHPGNGSYPSRTKIWDINSGKLIWDMEGYLEDFHPNKPLVIINNGIECSLINLDTMKVLLSWNYIGYYDWVVKHSSGLFDASPKVLDKVYFVENGKKIDSDELKEKYYKPGLWSNIMLEEIQF